MASNNGPFKEVCLINKLTLRKFYNDLLVITANELRSARLLL